MRRDGKRFPLAGITAFTRRVLTAFAMVAQCVMVLAPLTEIHTERPAFDPTARHAPAQHTSVSAAEPQPHDEALCPACVVHSLYARHAALTSLPSIGITLRTASATPPALRPRAADRSTLQSRAPPALV